ncbi:hypothetical protein MNBD_GAMMA22-2629 [hydrothermal vent metagenome]|uniref:Pyrroloquinoline quinone-dependent pyranose dehydrogenase beta-propeller domain-containing protein n=1 Tax=hydrothermal vent metagenome TaxID=652676 RepID=A0A3B1ABJ5_9ZZZZ
MRVKAILILILFNAYSHFGFTAVQKIQYHTQKIKILNNIFKIKLPKHYQLEFVAELEQPRIISISKKGEMFIGSKSGYVYRLTAPYTKAIKLLKLNNYPHSIVVRDNYIYIAQTNGLYRAAYKTGQNKVLTKNIQKYISLPGGFGHNSRTLALGKDNKLYLSLGISGNCSNQFIAMNYPASERRGGVMVLNEKNKIVWQPFATGLRNPVGFDWHPISGVMYASNNGPDHLGFNQPREYFSKLLPNSFHGMPWFQFVNNKIVRDNCINTQPPIAIDRVVKPVQTFDARNAPMAVSFINTEKKPTNYFGDALVALHGSWAVPNKTWFSNKKSGRREPKIVLVRFDNAVAKQVDDFITGFQLTDGSRWARPVGVINTANGDFYFTSDAGINGLFRAKKLK